MATVWESIEKLVHHTANQFAKRYGVWWEDIHQDACLAGVMALQTWDPDRGELSTHVHWKVWAVLQQALRREQKGVPAGHLEDEPEERRTNVVGHLLSGLSEAGREMACTALDLFGKRKRPRFALYRYLRSLDWGFRQLAKASTEVREALLS